MESVKCIKHIGIYVKDLEGIVHFYKEVFGFIELARYVDIGEHIDRILNRKSALVKICKLLTPFGKQKGQGDMLELICFPDQDGEQHIYGEIFTPGMAHIGIGVENVHQSCQRIQAFGGRVLCGPMQVQESGNYVAFCQDTEGNYLELIESR